jgi:hypothetical protein
LGVIIVLAIIAAFAAVVMFLWNSLMPDIAGLPVLDYWQALGILALSRILFSGIGGGLFGLGMAASRGRGRQNPLREKWMNMREEDRKAFMEREKDFKNMFRDRFSHFQDLRSHFNDMREFFDEHETKDNKERGDE